MTVQEVRTISAVRKSPRSLKLIQNDQVATMSAVEKNPSVGLEAFITQVITQVITFICIFYHPRVI